ncbi:hypothetical protein EUTSA_v10028007mg [Eutrema salsugineum]|uniref:Uncharacterized protein n=1 Tax=Eutrema salsugineum TaxID=72664 RepID=V4L9P5_EUTSA|nr:hypothetical protein EUTSA_v10028007mg [Eutrema salsugineum]
MKPIVFFFLLLLAVANSGNLTGIHEDGEAEVFWISLESNMNIYLSYKTLKGPAPCRSSRSNPCTGIYNQKNSICPIYTKCKRGIMS